MYESIRWNVGLGSVLGRGVYCRWSDRQGCVCRGIVWLEAYLMAIHVVNKGKNGEREVVQMLVAVLGNIIRENEFPQETVDALQGVVQRNQNQSAVGGSDISLFGLAIEVKRQETLCIPAWWAQAVKSAARNQDIPVLIYRQNRKAWKIIMDGFLPVGSGGASFARVEIELEDFLIWFKKLAILKIQNGEIDRA
jgi:hypothetical protein